jgi:hypothetical protein
MHRFAIIGIAVLLAGCAANDPLTAPGRSSAPGMVGQAGTWEAEVGGSDPSRFTTLNLPIGPAFQALMAIYNHLEIPVRTMDQTRGVIGVQNHQAIRSFAGQQMVRLLDCGNSLTGPNAATYRINLTVLSHLEATPDGGSRVRTQLEATGTPAGGGASTPPVTCRSTGRLEADIAQRMVQRAEAGR